MKKLSFILVFLLFASSLVQAQSISEIINKMDLDSLQLTLREFSGEQPTTINGDEVTITNRVYSNNELAADYLYQKLNNLNNITVTNQLINGETGRRNIIATQLGKTNPDNIYIICAHYDTVADYCADDNASGTATVLEIARILSTQCLDNTIVYALWDEEEIGLVGAGYYANQAATNNDNILGVLNIDMMGYDGNNDNNFDIDVRDVANSLTMKDDIISILNTPEYGFTLEVNVVNPGTTASDHSRFWNQDYSAVLVGESWETNDQTPFYHSSSDTYNTLNFPYYFELSKLIMGYMVTKAGLVNVDNTVTQSTNTLVANQDAVSYQWVNCDTNTAIAGATNQSFTPTINGTYAVEITSGSCIEKSECIVFDSLGLQEFDAAEILFYPNPVQENLVVEMFNQQEDVVLELYDITGKLVLSETSSKNKTILNLSDLASGVYFLKANTSTRSSLAKILKD
ncbi:M28 family peptidase [Lacinutrix sp. C3R15]|uniref:M28 family peptidase n=1 Tax=Flavobacteriaceae TaxID=49546 RepID=UPI001C09DF54|nr:MULTISPECIES: M28 family peptidase [Flavobacteriaceae]MBU2939101.1 M28 family peptidase [Lacinutrix sp. C3R15]MDO6622416.1 M28 family peptidase [Oceanihabitans sp. 1_MG-2023]